MRREHRALTDAEKADVAEAKKLGSDFLELIDRLGDSRETALARTKIEEAVMWAVKHVTA